MEEKNINFDLSPIEKIKKETVASWGIMTAQHMIEHLILAVQSSNGKISFTEYITPDKKLPVLKRFLLSSRPLPKLFVNEIIGEGLKQLKYSDLNTAIENLKEEVKLFDEYFDSNPNLKPINVTFGPLNKEEWITFHKKHFMHHFSQFGLI